MRVQIGAALVHGGTDQGAAAVGHAWQDFEDLYRPLATLDSPAWPHLMGRVLRFHDAVYMNHIAPVDPCMHRGLSWIELNFPSKSSLTVSSNRVFLLAVEPDPDDSSDDSADESS